MLLSIIIPVYNAGAQIKKCLDSISKIKEEEIEVIVINDGSTDKTESCLEEYRNKDKRFSFYKKENSGVSDTRNLGLSLCNGKYVTFIDADDTITEEYNQIIDIIKTNDCDLYSFDFVLCFNGTEKLLEKVHLRKGINDKETLIKEFFAGRSNNVWNHIYKTEIIRREQLLFEKEVKMGEDLLFNAKYIQLVEAVYFIDKAPYIYNADNTGSAMHNKRLSYLDDYIKIYDELVDVRSRYEGSEIDKGNYLLQVYEVLRFHGKTMTKEQEKRIRNSRLFAELMAESFRGQLKLIVKQFLLRFYLYRIWIP